MTEKHFKYQKPKDTSFYKLSLLTIFVLFGYIILREILSLIDRFDNRKMTMTVILSAIIISVIYIIRQIVFMRNEYDLVDREKEVIIDKNKGHIIIKTGTLEKLIRSENIQKVEIYESWTAAYPLGFFNYVKLLLKNGESIVITGFTLPLLDYELSFLLNGIKKIKFKRFINRLKINNPHENIC